MASWAHEVRWLTADQADDDDRWLRRCAIRGCEQPTAHHSTYQYTTGVGGRTSQSSRRLCTHHGNQFADRYHLEIGAPNVLPDPVVWPVRRGLKMQPASAGGWTVTLNDPNDAFTIWPEEAETHGGAMPAAEEHLARRYRLAVADGWRPDGPRNHAVAVLIEETAEWRHEPWAVDVNHHEGAWRYECLLDPKFPPITQRLGVNLDLTRAMATTGRLLTAAGWTLVGGWAPLGGHAMVAALHPFARRPT